MATATPFIVQQVKAPITQLVKAYNTFGNHFNDCKKTNEQWNLDVVIDSLRHMFDVAEQLTKALLVDSKYPRVEQLFHTKFMVALKVFVMAVRRAMSTNTFYYQPVETPFDTLKSTTITLVREINSIPPSALEVMAAKSTAIAPEVTEQPTPAAPEPGQPNPGKKRPTRPRPPRVEMTTVTESLESEESHFIPKQSSKRQPRVPLFLAGDVTLVVEEYIDATFAPILISTIPDYYKNLYFPKRHWNFAHTKKIRATGEIIDASFYSLVEGEEFRLLHTNKSGTIEQPLPEFTETLSTQTSQRLLEMLQPMVIPEENEEIEDSLYPITARNFPQQLLDIEEKYPQQITNMKIAIVYGKAGQEKAAEYFANDQPPRAFWEFCDLMGDRVEVSTLKGYTGDMTRGPAYYHNWREKIEVIYHVAALLDPEAGEHRQFIGNDIAIIFFLDPGASISPNLFSSLGNVPQLFVAVQPTRSGYRVQFAHRSSIQTHEGDIPEGHCIAPQGVRNRILAKLHNGFNMTRKCPPMNRMFYLPRAHALKELVDKFPPENPKDRKIREQNELRAHEAEVKRLQAEGQRDNIVIKVICANLLKDTNCFVKITFLSFKSKTKEKKSQQPIWNQIFVFSLLGGVLPSTEVYIDVLKKGTGKPELIGETVLCIGDIQKIAAGSLGPRDYSLRSEKGVKGQIYLEFTYFEDLSAVEQPPDNY